MICSNILWLYLLVWWWIKVCHLASLEYCGQLNGQQTCKEEYRIQFQPYANNTIKQWWMYINGYRTIQNGSAEYTFVELSLIIRNIATCENATFVVECHGENRTLSQPWPFHCTSLSTRVTPHCGTETVPPLGKQSPTVHVTLFGEKSTTVPTLAKPSTMVTSLDKQSPRPVTNDNVAVRNDNSTVIIVVAVCITVIVLTIFSTIVIIVCNRPFKETTAKENDVSIAQAHLGCGKHIGEDTDCALKNVMSINSSSSSKSLNRNDMILSDEQNGYAVIKDCAVGMCSDLKPTSMTRSREGIAEAQMRVYDVPKKAKAISDDNEKERQDADTLNKFNVNFPKIDMNVMNQCLKNEYKSITNNSEVHTYFNAMRRSQRMKSGSKRRELQYAMIGRCSSEINVDEPLCRRLEENKTDHCQYADIDFNKTAFVAPVRKAPSSWYKRRAKQNLSKKY